MLNESYTPFGSTLIKGYFSDFREPQDVDLLTSKPLSEEARLSLEKEFSRKYGKKCEIYYLPICGNGKMSPDEIYTLKVSHAIYDINWRKHMSDIRFLQLKGCKVIPHLLQDLRTWWKTIHTDKKYDRVDFNVDPATFFFDKVNRKHSHDDLHKIFNPHPSFELIVDEGSIKPVEAKFNALDFETQLNVILEEAYVLGVERFYGLTSYRDSYIRVQQMLVTRLQPVWLADFTINNWGKFYTAPINFYKVYEQNI